MYQFITSYYKKFFLKNKIIYIIGTGRSGTTLLDILLGNSNDIFSCGELNRFPKRNGIPPKRETGDEVAAFWQNINFHLDLSDKDLMELNTLHKAYEYHVSTLKGLLFGVSDKLSQTYTVYIKRLYRFIFSSIKENTIIDSSKYPGRAIMLSSTIKNEYDICYVYIVRNPVGVVGSLTKKGLEQPPKNWILANAYYFCVNLICQYTLKYLRRKGHQTLTVTYEQLTEEPLETIEKVGKELNFETESVLQKIRKDDYLNTGFLFDGNRIRLQKQIKLLRKPINKKQLTFKEKMIQVMNSPIYKS